MTTASARREEASPITSPDPVASAGAVYGGGGLFGIGFVLGVAEAFVDGGVDLASMPVVATSAGSWAAAGLALGVRFPEALERMVGVVPRIPDPRPGRLHAVAVQLFGASTRCPTVSVVACSLPRLRRVLLSGSDHPIADLVAASSAVPGLLAPHRIGGTRYVDGGVRSMASIDHAAPAGRLLVVLPLSRPMFGPAGWVIERGIGRELRTWTAANPDGRALVVRPTPEIVSLARRPDQLFDPDRARRCYDLAYQEGVALLDRWR